MLLRTRLHALIAAVAVGIVITGCGGSDPAPQPTPAALYRQIPSDLCENLRLGPLFEEFSLTLPPRYEPESDYGAKRDHWYELCTFVALGRDGQYSTSVGEFRPAGAVEVQVYHDVAGAIEAYDQHASNYFDLREETMPGTTTTSLSGWWGETGRSLETITTPNPAYTNLDIAVNDVQVIHLLRHENLVLMVNNKATTPSPDTAEVTALLHKIVDALIDETVTHLDRE
jgi:hypothetical protein